MCRAGNGSWMPAQPMRAMERTSGHRRIDRVAEVRPELPAPVAVDQDEPAATRPCHRSITFINLSSTEAGCKHPEPGQGAMASGPLLNLNATDDPCKQAGQARHSGSTACAVVPCPAVAGPRPPPTPAERPRARSFDVESNSDSTTPVRKASTTASTRMNMSNHRSPGMQARAISQTGGTASQCRVASTAPAQAPDSPLHTACTPASTDRETGTTGRRPPRSPGQTAGCSRRPAQVDMVIERVPAQADFTQAPAESTTKASHASSTITGIPSVRRDALALHRLMVRPGGGATASRNAGRREERAAWRPARPGPSMSPREWRNASL